VEANKTIQFSTNVLDIEEDIDLDDESIPTKQNFNHHRSMLQETSTTPSNTIKPFLKIRL
jgi:hypothetical protein